MQFEEIIILPDPPEPNCYTIVSNPTDPVGGNDSWFKWIFRNPPNLDSAATTKAVIAIFGDNEEHKNLLIGTIDPIITGLDEDKVVILCVPSVCTDVYAINGVSRDPLIILFVAGMEIKRKWGLFQDQEERAEFVEGPILGLVSIVNNIRALQTPEP
jgi:hypothetical protein